MPILPWLAANAAGLKAGGGVLSVIGSLFGGRKKNKTRTDFQTLRDDAMAAGYNPLTALKATGGAGNTISTTSRPALASLSFMGQAVSDFANVFDPMAQKRDELEVKLMQAELDDMQGARYRQPEIGGSNGHFSDPDHYDDPNDHLGAPSVYTDSGYTVAGIRLETSQLSSDGEVLEDRLGDFWGSVFATPNFGFDMGHTARGVYEKWREDRYFKNLYRNQYQRPALSGNINDAFSPDMHRPYYVQ